MYLIMEYCAGGDLATYIRSHLENQKQSAYGIPEATAQVFMKQLAAGLRAMWQMSLVHVRPGGCDYLVAFTCP
jgi:serine/threonine protein kinase